MTNTNTRIKRLEKLAADLKQDHLCTQKELAILHGVSERTIARDIQLLRDQGVPIDADRGRGGGVRVDRNWGVGRLNLSYIEAVELMISMAIAEQMGSPLFLTNLAAIKRQLEASLSPDKRRKVSGLKSRILIGETASTDVQGGFTMTDLTVQQQLQQGFLERTSLRINYRAENGDVTLREIEPHYLLLNYPIWYVLAYDHLRDAPRTFRCDRILSTTSTSNQFKLLDKTYFQQILEWHKSAK